MFEKESEQKVINAISLMDKIIDLYMAKYNMNFMDFFGI